MTDRRAFHDGRAACRLRESKRFYHELLKRHYAFLVPAGLRALEVGCGIGDRLCAVRPARGLGIEFSRAAIALASRRQTQLAFQWADARPCSPVEPCDYLRLPC